LPTKFKKSRSSNKQVGKCQHFLNDPDPDYYLLRQHFHWPNYKRMIKNLGSSRFVNVFERSLLPRLLWWI